MIAWVRRMFGAGASSVTLDMRGRGGELVYTKDDRRAAAYVEISGVSGYDLLVTAPQRWSDGSPISPADRAEIDDAFARWAKKTRTRCQW